MSMQTCSRCKTTFDLTKYVGNTFWGFITLKWSGEMGHGADGKKVSGAAVGGEAWLCLSCIEAFNILMHPELAPLVEAKQVAEDEEAERVRNAGPALLHALTELNRWQTGRAPERITRLVDAALAEATQP